MAAATKDAPTSANDASGFENAQFKLMNVPITKIRLGKFSLRDADRNSEEFQRLRDSIAGSNGPYLPILVREIDDPEYKGHTAYGLIDGLQRYSCCHDLGFTHIPARVIDMDDAEVAAAQIIANRSRIETKPVEYTRQLHRMLNANPTLTLEELSDQLHVSVAWLNQRLSLSNLHPKIGPLVDEGRIPLAHAFAMVKLKPQDEQLEFVEQAQTQTIQEFSGHVQKRVKALREAARSGREAKPDEFTPVPHMRAVKEIKAQLESPTLATHVCAKLNARTAEAGFHAGIIWALSMDPDTVAYLKEQDANRKEMAKDAKAKKDAEKIRKKAAEAREAAQKAGINLDDSDPEPSEEDEEDDDSGE